ncbi:MAG: hypothetical protein WA908_04545 [Pontixanthobacter sp.]
MRVSALTFFGSILALTGCSQSDAKVDAEFAEFCESFFGGKSASECADSSQFTTAEKREMLKHAPQIDEAFDQLDAQLEEMGAEMDAESERFEQETGGY